MSSKSQRRAQAESYTSKLAVMMGHFKGGWERRLDEASNEWAEERARQMGELEDARATQRRLESRIEALEAVIRDWGYDDEDARWEDGAGNNSGDPSTGARSGNRMRDPSASGTVLSRPSSR